MGGCSPLRARGFQAALMERRAAPSTVASKRTESIADRPTAKSLRVASPETIKAIRSSPNASRKLLEKVSTIASALAASLLPEGTMRDLLPPSSRKCAGIAIADRQAETLPPKDGVLQWRPELPSLWAVSVASMISL